MNLLFSTQSWRRVEMISLGLIVSCAVAGGVGNTSSRAQRTERTLESEIPKHVPIQIRFRANKEAAFKKFDNEHWVNDLEFEIKNTGNKPIYCFEFAIELPDVTPGADRHPTFGIHYGRPELLSFETALTPDDLPIKPGDTGTISVDANDIKAWEHFRKTGEWQLPKTIILLFVRMNFGDGTGLDGGDATPWPEAKRPF